MIRFWLVTTCILVFAAGGALGFLAFHQLNAEKEYPPLPDATPDLSPYLVAGEEIYKELALDPEQHAKIDALLAAHYKRVTEIRASLVDVSSELRQGISAALTPEQRQRFEEIQRQYGEREIQGRVLQELVNMRVGLELTPDQEPRVYQVLFDVERERRESVRGGKVKDRNALRAKVAEINARRDARFTEVLSSEQFTKYREMKERQERWWAERGSRRTKKRAEEAPKEATEDAGKAPSKDRPEGSPKNRSEEPAPPPAEQK